MIRPRAYMAWMAAGMLVLCTAARSAENAPLLQRSVRVEAEVQHDTSIPLRQMPRALRAQGQRVHPVLPLPRHGGGGVIAADPVLQSLVAQPLAPALTLNFDGVGNGFSGPAGTFTVAGAPPDTNGSVGPNHYVQIVNTDFAVFNKSGAALFGPVPINTLWSGFGGGCETNNDGDPVVDYDNIADRWVIAQPSFSTLPYLECVAVSTSGDPTGSYNRYSFSYGNTDFPDYPKIGVWPDAYYATFNFFAAGGVTFSGGEVCAYDRASMLVGQAATQQCFNVGTSFGGLLPADLDGARQPPAGSPNYVVSLGAVDGQLAFWKFHVDWTTPPNTTLTGPTATIRAARVSLRVGPGSNWIRSVTASCTAWRTVTSAITKLWSSTTALQPGPVSGCGGMNSDQMHHTISPFSSREPMRPIPTTVGWAASRWTRPATWRSASVGPAPLSIRRLTSRGGLRATHWGR